LQLFGNTVGHGTRQTTRLGMANQPFHPAPQLHADFRQLGGFSDPVSATITTWWSRTASRISVFSG
jgi:hypothetical protein